jgi:hypothetical protein
MKRKLRTTPNPETVKRLREAQRMEREQRVKLAREQLILYRLKKIRDRNGLSEVLAQVLKEGHGHG